MIEDDLGERLFGSMNSFRRRAAFTGLVTWNWHWAAVYY